MVTLVSVLMPVVRCSDGLVRPNPSPSSGRVATAASLSPSLEGERGEKWSAPPYRSPGCANGFSTDMARLERVSLTPGMRSKAFSANSLYSSRSATMTWSR
jgi:hypothetical protein